MPAGSPRTGAEKPGQGQKAALGGNQIPLCFIQPHQRGLPCLIFLFDKIPVLLYQCGVGALQLKLFLGQFQIGQGSIDL